MSRSDAEVLDVTNLSVNRHQTAKLARHNNQNVVKGWGDHMGSSTGPAATAHHHRSLFLSDLHLGALAGRPDAILSFLLHTHADHIYLVGDILDLWHPFRPVWSDRHQAVLDILRARAAAGAKIHYLYGNHDKAIATPDEQRRLGLTFATVAAKVTHIGADGQRYLVLHGDVVDMRLLRWSVCTRLGSRIDGLMRGAERRLRALRSITQEPEKTVIDVLSAWLNGLIYAGQAHERRLVGLARASAHDGVICGHFHIPALHDTHGIVYANCGDWVDSRTALVETHGGSLQLLDAQPQLAVASGAPTTLGQPATEARA